MKLRRAGGRAAPDASLIPMINVIFLLLVFFVMAGVIRAATPIPVAPPVSEPSATATDAPRVLYLASDGRLSLDGAAVTLSRLDALLAPGDTGDVDLALQADAAVPFGTLRATVQALRTAGVERLDLITLAAPRQQPRAHDE